MDLSILRRTAAEIAAAAVCELYPNVELLGGGDTSVGFVYEFFCPHPMQVQIIEEKMRQIVRENRHIRTLEMVPCSADALLRKEGHRHRAEELGEGLVELVQIDSFYDLSPAPHLTSTGQLAAFKIEIEPLLEGKTRLIGWCHFSKEELNKFLKLVNRYVEPALLGEQQGLWKGQVWFERGLKMRQKLLDFLKKHWFEGAVLICGPQNGNRFETHRLLSREKVADIWGAPQEGGLQVSFFHQSEAKVISSLQLIGKTLTILGFDHTSIFADGGVEFVVEDELGRKWPVVQFKKLSKKGVKAVDFYFTAAVERILALMLEKKLQVVEA